MSAAPSVAVRRLDRLVTGRVRAARNDPLVRNSLFLMLSASATAACGLVFWILVARFYSPSEVGKSTTLLSATLLISYLSLLGFNNTFPRFLARSDRPNEEINTGLSVVGGSAIIISVGFVAAIPLISPRLDFVIHSPAYAVAFVALTAAVALNLITDSVFIAYRSSHYNLLVDGVVQNIIKLAMPLLFVGLGAFGIYLAFGLAATVAALLSVYLMIKRFHFHPKPMISPHVLRELGGYSVGNYAANLFNIAPTFVLPILVFDLRGAAAAGFFYVAFQLANLLNMITYAIMENLLTEGGHGETPIGVLARRSARLQILLIIPAASVVCFLGPYLLELFGGSYRTHATAVLISLVASVPAVAFSSWALTLLRIGGHLRGLIGANAICALVVCGMAAALLDHGLVWVGVALIVGNVIAGAIACVILFCTWNTTPWPVARTASAETPSTRNYRRKCRQRDL